MGNVFRSVLAAARAVLQSKTRTATTIQQVVTADAGYDGLSSVTIDPQQHTETYTPAANTASNDMGAVHNKRYVNTSGMIVPTGNKSITANGTGIDVSSYATCSVDVPPATLDGDATTADVLYGKTFYSNSTTKQTGAITSKAAQTYNTSTSTQTISAGQYLSGEQIIRAVSTSGIDAANIKDGAVVKVGDSGSATRIKNVTGTFTDASTVSSGQTAATAAKILSGYSAWVDGAEVKGSYTAPTIQSITPSDSSPVALATTGNYNPTTTGYAIKNSPAGLTPNNTSPPSIASGTIYRGGGTGYAISSYSSASKTPSSSGTSFSLGWNYMTDAGYAYSSQPSSGYTYGWNSETTLWTNSSPTSNFTEQTVTLNSSIANYNYIRVYARASTTDSTSTDVIFKRTEFDNFAASATHPYGVIGIYISSSSFRRITKTSNTQVWFSATNFSGGGSATNRVIPTKITGLV